MFQTLDLCYLSPYNAQDKIEHKFLGAEFGNLVDLDSLTIPPPILNNPFGVPTSVLNDKPSNPFGTNKASGPTLNQIADSTSNSGSSAFGEYLILTMSVE